MSTFWNPIFGPPEEAYVDAPGYGTRTLASSQQCGRPWWCYVTPWWDLTFCREAESLEKACKAGLFNPNLAPGSGAGPAPPIAAQPGVNYNDPAVLTAISEAQKVSDTEALQRTIDANRRLISGDPGGTSPSTLNLMLIAAFVVLIGGLLLLRR